MASHADHTHGSSPLRRPPLANISPNVIWLAALSLLVVALFWRDAADMVRIWRDVSTYNHILVLPFLIGWLVQQRLSELKAIAPRIWAMALLPLAGAAALWILGEAAGVSVARHLALVVMLQSLTLLCLGPKMGMALAFPLFMAFFLVPFGDFLVPALQLVTADMSMVLLGWWGLPAHMEGVFISTPTGYFEVAEACSGIQFLVAMICFGAFAANLCFNSWLRRVLFMALCVAVPVIANGIRAWGTIVIAHYTSNDFAAGFDHILYGWIFFALVMALVMAMAWPFLDRGMDEPFVHPGRINAMTLPRWLHGEVGGSRLLAVAAILLALPIMWNMALQPKPADLPQSISLPDVPGWRRTDTPMLTPWMPRQDSANHWLLGRYADDNGAIVDLYIALYDGQEEGREIDGFGQGAHDPESVWDWAGPGEYLEGARSIRIVAPGPVRRSAATFLAIGDNWAAGATGRRLEMLTRRLLGQSIPASVVIVSAERRSGLAPAQSIASFVKASGGPQKLIDRAQNSR